MITGVDASQDLGAYAKDISLNYSFVGRYYSYSDVPAGFIITAAEAQQLSAAGLSIVTVWEYGSTSSYFTKAQGTRDAQQALTLAAGLGQPAGTAIYFAVDFNVQPSDLQNGTNGVVPYFTSIQTQFNGSDYQVGVYGSGLTCFTLLSLGLATYSWLSMSPSYSGTSLFHQQGIANIAQVKTINLSGSGPQVDIDVSPNENIGSFQVSDQTRSAALER